MQKLIFLLIGFTFSSLLHAQFQVGIFAGISNYNGDLVDRPFQRTRPAAGVMAAYQLSPRINIRAGFSFGQVAGADSLNKASLQPRNLSFRSDISELSLIGEFNTFDLNYKTWTPYIFAGLAVYHFNPYTYDQHGTLTYLQPLGTEGQGLPGYPEKKRYALTQLAIPLGGGVRFALNEKFRLGIEMGLRKLFTDYLDDVSGNYADPNDLLAAHGAAAVDISYRGDELNGGDLNYPEKGAQRGSPKYKDFYYFTGLHLIYVFPSSGGDNGGNYRPYRAGRKSQTGCPTVF